MLNSNLKQDAVLDHSYNLDQLFSNFHSVSDYSEEKQLFYQEKIKEFIHWDKPDFVALITPNEKEYISYHKNVNLNFHGHEETVSSAIQYILPAQMELITQIDFRTMDFLFEVDLKPMDLLLNLRFNIELKPGEVRTYIRKLHILVVDENGNPEVGLMGVTDVTQFSDIQKVDFQAKFVDETKIDQSILETFRSDIAHMLQSNIEFTKREREILCHISKGRTSKEIADCLNISKATVDTHRQNMLKKHSVKNINSLLQFANNQDCV